MVECLSLESVVQKILGLCFHQKDNKEENAERRLFLGGISKSSSSSLSSLRRGRRLFFPFSSRKVKKKENFLLFFFSCCLRRDGSFPSPSSSVCGWPSNARPSIVRRHSEEVVSSGPLPFSAISLVSSLLVSLPTLRSCCRRERERKKKTLSRLTCMGRERGWSLFSSGVESTEKELPRENWLGPEVEEEEEEGREG